MFFLCFSYELLLAAKSILIQQFLVKELISYSLKAETCGLTQAQDGYLFT